MEYFKCPSCKTEMILRNGKYGPFFYCKDHGTISMRAAEKITALLCTIEDNHSYSGGFNEDPLFDSIKRTSVNLGMPKDDLQQTIDFYNDHPPFNDDEDHWMNVRD